MSKEVVSSSEQGSSLIGRAGKAVGVLAVTTAALLAPVPAFADTTSGATVNFGACESGLAQAGEQWLIPYQAPGQSGNGPLTVVNGQVIVPAAFEGGMGCSR